MVNLQDDDTTHYAEACMSKKSVVDSRPSHDSHRQKRRQSFKA